MFFGDANVFIYAAVGSEYRDPCLETLEAIASGNAEGRTSTAVLEEVWHLELSGRAGTLDPRWPRGPGAHAHDAATARADRALADPLGSGARRRVLSA